MKLKKCLLVQKITTMLKIRLPIISSMLWRFIKKSLLTKPAKLKTNLVIKFIADKRCFVCV